jgi:hypothetical protein
MAVWIARHFIEDLLKERARDRHAAHVDLAGLRKPLDGGVPLLIRRVCQTFVTSVEADAVTSR